MAESRRGGGSNPGSDRPRSDQPRGERSRAEKPRGGKGRAEKPRPERTDRPRGERNGSRGQRGGRPDRDRGGREADRSQEQQRYDGPPLPEHITGREVSRSVAAQLKSLPEKLAQRVARHLAAAEEALDHDPRLAYEHTLAARARASRLAVVREAVGEAAYAAGEYAEALAELRAAKRMNGAVDYVPMMADCERALGRPDKALTLLRNVPREKLGPELAAEAVIVEAGARRDRGELDAALRTLEHAPLQSKSRAGWVVRLRYAYADILLAADRPADALAWFHRAEAIDAEETTDAGERAAQIERTLEA